MTTAKRRPRTATAQPRYTRLQSSLYDRLRDAITAEFAAREQLRATGEEQYAAKAAQVQALASIYVIYATLHATFPAESVERMAADHARSMVWFRGCDLSPGNGVIEQNANWDKALERAQDDLSRELGGNR
ncbi:hypothetical protein [Actinokineospora sp. UTMC 2448]|uniref:hypothetical protein n=1 Tax=Actinokineospora sp. UTMC 2448 TaxID=2268449 RepID=UPI0021649DD3|nr:hypothetical protein [Actinokineospora sp. UTMC 2448]UVS81810.1 hypothetical protein Actkin_05574 [Actinokineospora sp. UTMC 2448]